MTEQELVESLDKNVLWFDLSEYKKAPYITSDFDYHENIVGEIFFVHDHIGSITIKEIMIKNLLLEKLLVFKFGFIYPNKLLSISVVNNIYNDGART